MTWNLEAAKKRCEEFGDVEDDVAFFNRAVALCNTDLPAAIARCEWQEKMLERVKELMDHHIYVCEVYNLSEGVTEVEDLLRDMEKGPPDVA